MAVKIVRLGGVEAVVGDCSEGELQGDVQVPVTLDGEYQQVDQPKNLSERDAKGHLKPTKYRTRRHRVLEASKAASGGAIGSGTFQVRSQTREAKLTDSDKDAVRRSPAYKEAYLESKIPGVDPKTVLPNGRCEYDDDVLESVREALPDTTIEGHDRLADFAKREKQVTQLEILMMKGVTSPTLLSQILQVTRQQVAGLIKAVHTRWELLGGPRTASRAKGEAIAKITLMENEYWSLFQKDSTPVSSKISILSNLLTLTDRKLLLQGLSPRVLEAIAVEAQGENDEKQVNPMNESLRIQAALSEATKTALQLIAQHGAQGGSA